MVVSSFSKRLRYMYYIYTLSSMVEGKFSNCRIAITIDSILSELIVLEKEDTEQK